MNKNRNLNLGAGKTVYIVGSSHDYDITIAELIASHSLDAISISNLNDLPKNIDKSARRTNRKTNKKGKRKNKNSKPSERLSTSSVSHLLK